MSQVGDCCDEQPPVLKTRQSPLGTVAVQLILDAQLLLPVQPTSHAHEFPHCTSRHEPVPEHLTSHFPAPHCTAWQLP